MRDTTGLKWAPEIGAKIEIIMTKVRPVDIAFPNNVMPSSLESLSAIIPEPTTVKTRKNDPINSEAYFWFLENFIHKSNAFRFWI